MKRMALRTGFCLLGCVAIATVVFPIPREIAFHLIFGWIYYLQRVVPQVNFRSDGVVVFGLGLCLWTLLLHWIARWLRREMSDSAANWRSLSTLALVALLIVSFIAGIAMVGLTHQTVWLVTDGEPLLVPVLRAAQGESEANLRQTALCVHTFHDFHRRLPSPAINAELPEQSWITRVLPYLPMSSSYDSTKAWNDPVNDPVARKIVPALLNSGIRPAVLRDDDGYGVSHYAGNFNVLEASERISLDDISDGLSNTLLSGEVSSDFKPWAKPRSNRDPALGVNRVPHGFGGPAANGGAYFAMADGSVRLISKDVDLSTMRSLATPSGND